MLKLVRIYKEMNKILLYQKMRKKPYTFTYNGNKCWISCIRIVREMIELIMVIKTKLQIVFRIYLQI